MRTKASILLVIINCILFNLISLAQVVEEKVIQDFLNLISNKEYKKAYNCLSHNIKEKISLFEFSNEAKDIKKIKFLKLDLIESSINLKKYNLKVWVALIYKGRYYKALYSGKVYLNKLKDKWYVFLVELNPIVQKEINKQIYFGI